MILGIYISYDVKSITTNITGIGKIEFKNVVIAGGGALGSQIAYQTAFKGFNVKAWLRSEGSIGRAKPKLERFKKFI